MVYYDNNIAFISFPYIQRGRIIKVRFDLCDLDAFGEGRSRAAATTRIISVITYNY